MSDALRQGGIAILDFGSQYTQLIARRVREQGVYAEVLPFDATPEQIRAHQPNGLILSGGPNSIYADSAPALHPGVRLEAWPMLGVCYGMQLIAQALGGAVSPGETREYGRGHITHGDNVLFRDLPDALDVWMSHGDHVEAPPHGFDVLATSDNGLIAAIGDADRKLYGVQFHPEVAHTPRGVDLIRNFVFDVCNCEPKWSPAAFIEDAVERIQAQVGDDGRVLLALSGGVDSAVAGALIQQAIGDRLTSVFVNTGLLRKGEPAEVVRVFREERQMRLIAVDASERFLSQLQDLQEPEAKRKRIGAAFIDVFREEADRLDDVHYLGQGTIYPDVIESAAEHQSAKTIKSHHNVGGLPPDFKERFTLVEPLRDLFKDEVRKVGTALGLPDHVVWRQPFPGPGLAIRCLGPITWERLETLREADAIFLDELAGAGLLTPGADGVAATSQCFAVLLPVKSVGVMGDNRTYEEVLVLRAVTTDDFMTADWARLPFDLLARASNRIVNNIKGINRVTYDVTSKPPATIEWE
jgi:GMP synthase (glutamine-hydrolysing)